MRDGSDRCLKSITLYNELILNGLKRKVIDSKKMTFKKINRGKGNCSASIFYKLKISAKIETISISSKQKPITSLAKNIFFFT